VHKVTISQAKDQLSSLIKAAVEGNEVVITKCGQPVVKLVPIKKIGRPFGVLTNKITINDDFDASLPQEILEEFSP